MPPPYQCTSVLSYVSLLLLMKLAEQVATEKTSTDIPEAFLQIPPPCHPSSLSILRFRHPDIT